MSTAATNEDGDDKRGDVSKSLQPEKGDAVADPEPGRPALEILPAEVWTKVFLQNHLTWSSSSQRETAGNRLVCKAWMDVIDEQLLFRITLDDRKIDITSLDHLNVKRCLITHLLSQDFGQTPTFRDASKLKELLVWGPITPPNFQALMQQFSQITTLSLTNAAFQNKNLLMANPDNFWTQLKNLTVTWNSWTKPPSPEIFNLPVRNLTSFTFSWHVVGYQLEDNTLLVSLFNFISRMTHLKKLDLQYYKYAASQNTPPSRFPTEDLQKVQKLETVRLTTNTFLLASWIPLLQLQTRLSEFRITNKKMEDSTLSAHLLKELKIILVCNKSTLTSFEMTDFELSQPLDCSMFQNMKLLKRLVLKRRITRAAPVYVTNLSVLPKSLEILSLTRLCCTSDDLNLMNERLDNIKSVKLDGIEQLVFLEHGQET